VTSKPPLIGVSSDIRRARRWGEGVFAGLPYVQAVAQAGGMPVVIPATTDRVALAAALARLDGLVLIGGRDIHPNLYGQKIHPQTRLADRRRLVGEQILVELALAGDLPLLGICMGCQWINVVAGGDLIQDIPSQVGTAVRHAPKETFHPARVAPDSHLASILGRTELEVNSSHHQAIGRLAPRLRAVAWAPDGIIEAAEGPGERFLLAVQWHPERLADRLEQLVLFQALVHAAMARKTAHCKGEIAST
jgi:putative glutamine amidotransferase